MSPSTDRASAGSAPEAWTRADAIARLRVGLLRLSDGEHSMCQVAAELGVFCWGFRRWSDGEFLRRWTRIIGRSTHLTRAQLEQVADLWQLSEQLRLRVPIACDVQTSACGGCRGWNEFSNTDLERFCADILGRNVVIRGIAQNTQIAQHRTGPGEMVVFALDSGAGPSVTLNATSTKKTLKKTLKPRSSTEISRRRSP